MLHHWQYPRVGIQKNADTFKGTRSQRRTPVRSIQITVLATKITDQLFRMQIIENESYKFVHTQFKTKVYGRCPEIQFHSGV